MNLKFNSHKNHNPECDILQMEWGHDSFITYGIYVKGKNKGEEFCEYYSGENYVPDSKSRSFSRMYERNEIPKKYFSTWQDLRHIYKTKYENTPSETNIYNISNGVIEPFDAFEIHPCKEYNRNTAEAFVEQVDDEKDAEFWSVYVHNVNGGLYCIADCETREQAHDLVTLLESIVKHAKLP